MSVARPVIREGGINARWLLDVVSTCLHVPVQDIDRNVPLVRYGLDSLAAIQLKAAIEDELGREAPDSVLLDYPDIESLERYMNHALSTEAPVAPPVAGFDSSLRQMLTDSELPDDIRPERNFESPSEMRSTLLTGATGFLGAHILSALLQNTDMRIYCLVRTRRTKGASDRIRSNLETYGLWKPLFAGRIEVVSGDLLQSRLGLSDERYEFLCREIDTIYHCGASVNWVYPYTHLRDANVLSTTELLRIACRYRPKPFHFISTISTCYSTAAPAVVQEKDDTLPNLSGIHFGYAQSKCVAETLVRRASERGLRATIHRPSLICGDSESGLSNTDDFLTTFIKGCIRMETAPDLDWMLDCCPVDYVADAIVKLSLTARDELGVFHFSNSTKCHWRAVVLWMRLYGYRIRLVSYEAWLDQLEVEAANPDHPLHPLRSFFLSKPPGAGGLSLPELYEEENRNRVCSDRSNEALETLSIRFPALDVKLLDRYFRSYIERGVLPASGPAKSAARQYPVARDFFEGVLRRYYRDESLEVHDISTIEMSPGNNSIITEMTSWKYESSAGLSLHRLAIDSAKGSIPRALDVFVKAKPRDAQVIDVGACMAALCGDDLGRAFARHMHRMDAVGSHLREIGIYGQRDNRFKKHTPVLYGSLRDDARNAWILALENLSSFELLDSASDVRGWRCEHIEKALEGIAEVHAIWYGREEEVKAQPWLGPVMTANVMVEMSDLWESLSEYSERVLSKWVGPDVGLIQRRLIETSCEWWPELELMPRTLIHNDFNPRNIAFRSSDAGPRLCAYDWELATLRVPQHDLAELLCFVLTPNASMREVFHYAEIHRRALERATESRIDQAEWLRGLRLSLYDLILNRLPMYILVHTFHRQPYMERVVKTWRRLYQLVDDAEFVNCTES